MQWYRITVMFEQLVHGLSHQDGSVSIGEAGMSQQFVTAASFCCAGKLQHPLSPLSLKHWFVSHAYQLRADVFWQFAMSYNKKLQDKMKTVRQKQLHQNGGEADNNAAVGAAAFVQDIPASTDASLDDDGDDACGT